MERKIIIVGGVAGGASAAARLRRLDENAEIILFEKGEYISFANCGLPYHIGGEIAEKSALVLQTPESFRARFEVDVRVFSEVSAIDTAAKTVTVRNRKTGETYTEGYDKLILSPGAEPIKPPVEGVDASGVFTLRNIPDTLRIKEYIARNGCQTAAVVGGGYIGVEMAENLSSAGLAVTVVEMQDQVIAPLDYDMACEIHRYLEMNGVKLMLGTAMQSIRESEGGLAITLDKGELHVDLVILAIGVRPESALAKNAELAVTERGAIIVGDDMRTSDPDVYAVGDAVEVTDFVTGQKTVIPLAGPANKQGRIAADNVAGGKSRYTGTQGSAILKVFDMTVATTGINEKTAKRLGLDYDKSFTYSASHATYYPGATNMSIKTIFEKGTGKILGAQVVGFDGCDKRCDVIATAIRFGATAEDLTQLELCYAPPYSSAKDPVNMAGFAIENLLRGRVKSFHWHEIAELQGKDDVILLDTRTAMEYENGHIDGFLNIPLDELRERLGELDRTKKVYVTCQIGQRGYVASRILTQHGFDCYNLSGGYRLYRSIFAKSGTPRNAGPMRINPEAQRPPQQSRQDDPAAVTRVDACGLSCPGPIVKLSSVLQTAKDGDVIEIQTTDPAFSSDIEGFCRRTGNEFISLANSKGVGTARIRKRSAQKSSAGSKGSETGKNFIVFSGDLDKAIASFIMANAAAAMGRKVSMFFTFWGLNILRKPGKVRTEKNFTERMFSCMTPRGAGRLGLSKMNMGGMGAKMIRSVMKKKNISSLEELMAMAQKNGVELVACSMSMDVMGIKESELIDGVKLGGAAAMLAHAEESDMSLFI